MNCRRLGRRRGFTLLEILTILGLLAIFIVLSSRIFYSIFKNIWGLSAMDTSAAQIDSAIGQLRSDVWAASEMDAQPHRLTLHLPEDRTVTWLATPAQPVVRTDSASAPRTWKALPAAFSFHEAGPLLELRLGLDPASVFTLPSQQMLLSPSTGAAP